MNNAETQYGVLGIIPGETFDDPPPIDAAFLTMDEILGDAPIKYRQILGEWPKVTDAILREGQFILEAGNPILRALLRFSPAKSTESYCEIRQPPGGRAQMGKITGVKPIAPDETDSRFSKLMSFKERYIVATIGTERPQRRLYWLVGLNHYKIVSTTKLESEWSLRLLSNLEMSDLRLRGAEI
jgi:hypothetical protein